ncbi:MAG: hypothetical protein ABI467_17745 [Kofleriaceae bacterium]
MSYAFVGDEPIEQREAVVGIVQQVLRTLDVVPGEICCTKPDGNNVRDRACSWDGSSSPSTRSRPSMAISFAMARRQVPACAWSTIAAEVVLALRSDP